MKNGYNKTCDFCETRSFIVFLKCKKIETVHPNVVFVQKKNARHAELADDNTLVSNTDQGPVRDQDTINDVNDPIQCGDIFLHDLGVVHLQTALWGRYSLLDVVGNINNTHIILTINIRQPLINMYN